MDAGGREWWGTRWFAVAATLIACAPLLYPPFPPLTDAAEHAGRYRIILDHGTGPLSQWYSVHWRLVGNMGVDVLVTLIGPLIGLEPAVKLVAMLSAALTTLGCLAISRVVHGRVSPFALFALPLAYNFTFHSGFLNFSLAMPLALNALALWLWMTPGLRRAGVFVPIAILIWATHVVGWAVLALTAFAAEWARVRNPIRAGFACWPLAAPLPLMLLWSAGATGPTTGFFAIESKLIGMLMAFRDTWFVVDLLTFATVLGVIIYGAVKATSARPIVWAALALLAAFALLPIWLMGSAFTDTRLAAFVLISALLALRPVDARQARIVALAGVVFFGLRIAATTASLALASDRQVRETVALDHIPVGSRVVQFVSPDCANGWRMARLDHIGGLAQVRRRVFINSQFPDIGATLLITDYPAARPFEGDPSHLLPCDGGAALKRRLAAFPRAAFDRLWLVAIPEGLPNRIPGATMIWRDGNSAVYRIDRP